MIDDLPFFFTEADFQIGDWYWLEKKHHISTSNGGQRPPFLGTRAEPFELGTRLLARVLCHCLAIAVDDGMISGGLGWFPEPA